jgi:hypothetical protein
MRIGFRLAYAGPGRDIPKATVFILCTYTSTKYYIRLRICLLFPHPALLCSARLFWSSLFSRSIPPCSMAPHSLIPLCSALLCSPFLFSRSIRRARRRCPPHVRSSSMVMHSACPTSKLLSFLSDKPDTNAPHRTLARIAVQTLAAHADRVQVLDSGDQR